MDKLLLAYDGTEASRRALDLAALLARQSGAHLAVVSVVPVHAGRTPVELFKRANLRSRTI